MKKKSVKAGSVNLHFIRVITEDNSASKSLVAPAAANLLHTAVCLQVQVQVQRILTTRDVTTTVLYGTIAELDRLSNCRWSPPTAIIEHGISTYRTHPNMSPQIAQYATAWGVPRCSL